jgi:hypothetical protein
MGGHDQPFGFFSPRASASSPRSTSVLIASDRVGRFRLTTAPLIDPFQPIHRRNQVQPLHRASQFRRHPSSVRNH